MVNPPVNYVISLVFVPVLDHCLFVSAIDVPGLLHLAFRSKIVCTIPWNLITSLSVRSKHKVCIFHLFLLSIFTHISL